MRNVCMEAEPDLNEAANEQPEERCHQCQTPLYHGQPRYRVAGQGSVCEECWEAVAGHGHVHFDFENLNNQ
jgi:hypothetical protein